MGRIIRRVIGALLIAAALAYAFIGWRYSNELLAPDINPVFDVSVIAVGGDRITLTRTESSAEVGVYGFEFPDGYGQVSDVLREDEAQVERRFTPAVRRPQVDQRGRLDVYAFDGTPKAVDVAFEDVRFDSDAGAMPAWRTSGTRDTWVIFVHGPTGSREEALRVLPLFAQAGYPTLTIALRDDLGAPASGNGLFGLGWNEWRDLHAAAAYAVEEGAQDFVLVGSSTGAQTVSMFLHESRYADHVRGVILDSPVLDWEATLAFQAEERGLPTWFVPATKAVSYVREGIRWSALDQRARADEFDVPILLIHGDADEATPVEVSDDFAAVREDLVTYERLEGVGHIRGWNVDRERYEAAITAFLTRVVG